MINPQELRLGNCIYDFRSQKNVLVHTLGDGQPDSADINNDNCSAFEPIVLTQEWLLKLGFRKEYNFEPKYNVYLKDHLVFNTSQNGWWIFNTNKHEVYPKYVHSLQNLYYAIHGKELEVNL